MTRPKHDISKISETQETIQEMLKKEVAQSSKDIAEYVCQQVGESLAPIYRMLGELSSSQERIEKMMIKKFDMIDCKLEDHERRILKLEKFIR